MTTDAEQCPYCHKKVAASWKEGHIAKYHAGPQPHHRGRVGSKIRRYTCEKCGRSVAENWRTRHEEKYHPEEVSE